MLNTRKVVENKAVTSTPFKQPQEEKNKQNIKGIPTKEQESLADELIEKDKQRIKREAGDGDVIIRVIFEGARKPDGDHDDTIIEQEVKKGNPNKPKEIYQIYVKGLTENNGLTAAGSIIRRWITEPNFGKVEIDRLAPKLLTKMETTILPPSLDYIKRPIRFDANRPSIDNYPLNDVTLQEVADILNKNSNKQVFVSANGAFALPQNLADRTINAIFRNMPRRGLRQLSINQLLNLRVQAVIQKLITTFKVNPRQLYNTWENGDPFAGNTQVDFRYIE